MILDQLIKIIFNSDPLALEGDCSFILPKSKVMVKIQSSYYIDHKKESMPLHISFEHIGRPIFEFTTGASGGNYYNLSWSDNEKYFVLTDISQWYEDLYFIDLDDKKIVHSITGLNEEDGSRAIVFYKNCAVILPTLNYEGGVSDLKIFDFTSRTTKTVLSSEQAIYNGLLTEDYCISRDSQYLFIRSNAYRQYDLHNESCVKNSKTLGPAFENLFNIKIEKSTLTCLDMAQLVEKGFFLTSQIHIDLIPNSKMFMAHSTYPVYNLCFVSHLEHIFPINVGELYFSSEIFKPIKLSGEWDDGYALALHTLSSKITIDRQFETQRSELGKLLYEIKYHNNYEALDELGKLTTGLFEKVFVEPSLGNLRKRNFDIVIPIPPSNIDRQFQPVEELTNRISKITGIQVDSKYLTKTITPELKQVVDYDERITILKDAFMVPDKRYKGMSVLIFDDLYRSGATLNAASRVLREHGEVSNIYVLTITKTRVKR